MPITKERYFCVKDFEKLQHYKRRSPPWVKLYNEMLDDENFISMSIESRHHLVMLFLIASKRDNVIPLDVKYLKKFMRVDEEPDLTQLFQRGFLLALNKRDASKRIANRLPNALSETKTESEKKREKKESELEANRSHGANSISFKEKTIKKYGLLRDIENSISDENSSASTTKNNAEFDPPPPRSDVKRYLENLRSSLGKGSLGFASATQGLKSGQSASLGLNQACRGRVEIDGRLKFCEAIAVRGVGERARCMECVAMAQARMNEVVNINKVNE